MLLQIVTSLLLAGAPDAVAAASPTDTAQPPAERKICRRDIETGSLVKGKKICMTAKQWQKASDANRDELESRASSGGQNTGH